jgi:serine/threonine-protein kinase HipA
MIKRLTVWLDFSPKLKVGELLYKDGRIFFEYDRGFLDSSLPISPYKLPLKEGLFECDDRVFDGLWGVFADSLPDGWGRLLVDRHLRKMGVDYRAITPLDRLSFAPDFALGALSYEPHEALESGFLERIELDKIAYESQAILKGDSEEMIEELLRLNGSSGGARPKALIQLSDDKKEIYDASQPLKEGFSHWMVKFASSTDSRDMGAIEYAYSLMAKKAGLTMSDTTLLHDKKGAYFASKRFDREGDKKLHLHSVAGLIHSDFRYPTLDYDDLLNLTLHLTKNAQALTEVFRLACFNLFGHNRDDHAKNFSFIMNRNGEWSFSPVYDVVFSYGVGSEHSTTYLGEGRKPTEQELLKLAKKHHIPKAKEIIAEVKDALSNWSKIAKEVGVSQSSINEIAKTLNSLF